MAQEHTNALHNTSEIGRLRTVMLHRPGRELENLMPEYLERLLFDDIPYLKVAQQEHDEFARCLTACGAQVLYLEDLVAQTIADPQVRRELVEQFPRMLPTSHLSLPGKDVIFLRTKGTKWDFLGEMFRSGVKEAERGKAESDGIVLGNTIVILSQIARALTETSTVQLQAEKPELLDRIMAYIEEHLAEKITLEETAHHFYISVSTITQLFRQKMGTSFYRLVTQRRLIAAKTRIQQGESLEDVSRSVGFQDYSSFYRAFKKEYGISPRQFTRL